MITLTYALTETNLTLESDFEFKEDESTAFELGIAMIIQQAVKKVLKEACTNGSEVVKLGLLMKEDAANDKRIAETENDKESGV
jgi:hypothetical protein